MSCEDSGDERRREEVLKLRFEYFKHMTTLSTAAALVVLAIFREAPLVPATLVPVGGFGFALVASFGGMYEIARSDLTEVKATQLKVLLIASEIGFIFGSIVTFISIGGLFVSLSAMLFRTGLLMFVVGCLVLLYYLLGWVLRRRQDRRNENEGEE